jgi:hypothetical protein
MLKASTELIVVVVDVQVLIMTILIADNNTHNITGLLLSFKYFIMISNPLSTTITIR